MRASDLLLGFAGVAAACNGNNALCGRKYSDVTFLGSHNSAFDGFGPAHNQYLSVTEQLNLGVRWLTVQTQNKDGQIQVCHTDCALLDEGPLSQYLDEISNWMDDHPRDVVTVLVTNIDALPITQFADAFRNTDLEKYVFRPGGRLAIDQWPTLQKLIDDGKRLVVFMDYNSDINRVDYIIPEFDFYWETPFGETDANFPRCNIDRPSGVDPTRYMYIVNHVLNFEIPFLGIKIPDQINAPRTNSLDSINKQVNLCQGMWGRKPNVILLDWINVGESMRAQNLLNGL